MHDLIGRTMTDPAFRANLVQHPERTVKDAGYELTEQQMAGLNEHDLTALSADPDVRMSKEAYWDLGALLA